MFGREIRKMILVEPFYLALDYNPKRANEKCIKENVFHDSFLNMTSKGLNRVRVRNNLILKN